jgi:ribosome maturation factor RimP
MRENSRRGTPRQARSEGRAGAGRDGRSRSPAGRGSGPGSGRAARDGRPGPGNRGSAPGGSVPGAADAARVTSVIEPVLLAMDVDLEGVRLATAGRRRVLRVIVDADGGVSLDDIADISREISARLDAKNTMGDAPYTLEVSSPGVDRPLTQPRHWRRAIGRLVIVGVADDNQQAQPGAPAGLASQTARVIDADHENVTLEIGGAQRTVSYGELGPGRVQVEFGRLSDEEDPDEEGPDGH